MSPAPRRRLSDFALPHLSAVRAGQRRFEGGAPEASGAVSPSRSPYRGRQAPGEAHETRTEMKHRPTDCLKAARCRGRGRGASTALYGSGRSVWIGGETGMRLFIPRKWTCPSTAFVWLRVASPFGGAGVPASFALRVERPRHPASSPPCTGVDRRLERHTKRGRRGSTDQLTA